MAYMHHPIASGLPNLNNAMPSMPRIRMSSLSGCTAHFPESNGFFIDGPEIGPDFPPTFAMGHGWYAPSLDPKTGSL
jgi:hypothetical protein